jgi:hypothetical protein
MFYGWKFTSGGQCGWAWGDRASQMSERKLPFLKRIVYSRSTHEKPQKSDKDFYVIADFLMIFLRYFVILWLRYLEYTVTRTDAKF